MSFCSKVDLPTRATLEHGPVPDFSDTRQERRPRGFWQEVRPGVGGVWPEKQGFRRPRRRVKEVRPILGGFWPKK